MNSRFIVTCSTRFGLLFQAIPQTACDNERDFWNVESSCRAVCQNSKIPGRRAFPKRTIKTSASKLQNRSSHPHQTPVAFEHVVTPSTKPADFRTASKPSPVAFHSSINIHQSSIFLPMLSPPARSNTPTSRPNELASTGPFFYHPRPALPAPTRGSGLTNVTRPCCRSSTS